ncbi:MAG: thioredoxin [Myxococcota bacterium]
MATQDLDEATFREHVQGEGILLVDFWASWCGPCRMFAPIFEKVSEAHEDVVFGKVDTDAQQALAGGMGIRSIPTLMLFRDGVLLMNQAGVVPEEALHDILAKAKELDMEQVKKEIAEAEAEGEGEGEGEAKA